MVQGETTLVGYWRLGEQSGVAALDSGPLHINGTYAHTGTGLSGVTIAVKGALISDPDTAAEFDGIKGLVRVGYDLRLNPAQNFSLEAWIRPAAAAPAGHPSAHTVLSSRQLRTPTRMRGFELTVVRDPAAQQGIQARIGSDGPTDHVIFVPLTWPQPDWVHVVFVCDVQALLPAPKQPKLLLHVNAGAPATAVVLPVLTPPATNYRAASGRDLLIGAGLSDQPNPGDFFAGVLDEVAIYNAALTGTQVAAHFKAR